MIDFVVFSLGCKVNTYEGQSMIARLIERGYSATDELKAAQNYIINTCSVTSEADKKSRQMVARVKKLNENARVYVCGCSSQNDADSYFAKSGVHLIGGASGKIELLDKILQDIDNKAKEKTLSINPLPLNFENAPKPSFTKTRGLIKIQDGCNNFCSYCIIPHLRGRSRSRSMESILDEAREASKHSCEIILTGINVSAYGEDIGTSLEALVKKLGGINARKRLGSLECHVITPDFVKAMKENGFCDHVHLSMQSGSNSVLKRMNRHYSAEEFIEKTEIIRQIYPNCGITSDIIAGFAGETEQEFFETVEVVKKVKFSDAHIFPYSERKGTKAALLSQIDKNIRVDRAKQLTNIKNEIRFNFLSSQIGKNLEVYFEETDGNESAGYSSNYIKIYSKKSEKAFKNIKVNQVYKDGLQGE